MQHNTVEVNSQILRLRIVSTRHSIVTSRTTLGRVYKVLLEVKIHIIVHSCIIKASYHQYSSRPRKSKRRIAVDS